MDCTTCIRYAGKLVNENGLCRLKGPLRFGKGNNTKRCKQYIEQKDDEIILNSSFCHTCKHFTKEKVADSSLLKGKYKVYGQCVKYDWGIYDGYTRKACSNYEQPLGKICKIFPF